MIKEYIYDWDELQYIFDDRGRLTPDEAAAYLACKEEEFEELIENADSPEAAEHWSDDIGNINYYRRKLLNPSGNEWMDLMIANQIEDATQCPYDFKGLKFSFKHIKDLDPETGIWFLRETLEWSIGRPTWRQIAKNLHLRIYIRIS